MLYHHELEKYIFSSRINDNRKVLTLPYQSGVSQFAFIYLQATDHLQEKEKRESKQTKQNTKQNTATFIKENH